MVIIVLATGGYFYIKYRNTQKLLANPQEAAKVEISDTVKKVSALVEVPDGEEPTVATVSDAAKLKDKPFFAHAQDGDRVVVYAKAQKAILYRPSTNKIVEMAPVAMPETASTQESSPAATPAAKPAEKVTVTILNGTDIKGLAAKAETKLSDQSERYTVEKTDNAAAQGYTKTLVVDVGGGHEQTAADLATLLGGEVAKLPDGEESPSTALLVIVGKDFTP